MMGTYAPEYTVCDPLRDNLAHPAFFECVCFKDAYLQNAMCYLNETWIVYTGGIAAAITQK